jgi:uncharacterized protein (TIGR03083 family)
VLRAAFAARPPVTTTSAYAAQAAGLAELLDGLSPAQWQAPTADGRTVRDLVLHLTANDSLALTDLATPDTRDRDARGPNAGEPNAGEPNAGEPNARLVWRDRSDRLLRVTGDDLVRPVQLAGKVPMRRPMREALTQRAFETWIHQDDIRLAVALPPAPPEAGHLSRILAFGLALLPGALDAAGRGRPGSCVRLVLTGPGGVSHLAAMSARGASLGSPLAEVAMPAERFGRLMAGRVPVAGAAATVTGERAAALDLLTVAATLGCE